MTQLQRNIYNLFNTSWIKPKTAILFWPPASNFGGIDISGAEIDLLAFNDGFGWEADAPVHQGQFSICLI